MLPAGVEKVFMRSDSAGYQQEMVEYSAEGEHERFGAIEFAVSADVTEAFRTVVREVKEEDWKPLRRLEKDGQVATEQQWTEVQLVSQEQEAPEYRFMAIREPLKQPAFPRAQAKPPFPVEQFNAQPCKLFGVKINRTGEGEEIIRWHRERCGKSKEAQALMKSGSGGGQVPLGQFWRECRMVADHGAGAELEPAAQARGPRG